MQFLNCHFFLLKFKFTHKRVVVVYIYYYNLRGQVFKETKNDIYILFFFLLNCLMLQSFVYNECEKNFFNITTTTQQNIIY